MMTSQSKLGRTVAPIIVFLTLLFSMIIAIPSINANAVRINGIGYHNELIGVNLELFTQSGKKIMDGEAISPDPSGNFPPLRVRAEITRPITGSEVEYSYSLNASGADEMNSTTLDKGEFIIDYSGNNTKVIEKEFNWRDNKLNLILDIYAFEYQNRETWGNKTVELSVTLAPPEETVKTPFLRVDMELFDDETGKKIPLHSSGNKLNVIDIDHQKTFTVKYKVRNISSSTSFMFNRSFYKEYGTADAEFDQKFTQGQALRPGEELVYQTAKVVARPGHFVSLSNVNLEMTPTNNKQYFFLDKVTTSAIHSDSIYGKTKNGTPVWEYHNPTGEEITLYFPSIPDPEIKVRKTANVDNSKGVLVGTKVRFTYEVENTGNTKVNVTSVVDDKCNNILDSEGTPFALSRLKNGIQPKSKVSFSCVGEIR